MLALLEMGYPKSDVFLYETYFRDPEKAAKAHQSDPNLWKSFVLEEYSHVFQTKGLGDSYRWSSFLFAGWSEKEFRDLARKIWIQEWEKTKDLLETQKLREMELDTVHPRFPLLDLVHRLQEKGWDAWIVTASPTWAIQECTPELGIQKENVLGMNLTLETKNGSSSAYPRTSPKIIEPYPYGEGKVSAIQKFIQKEYDLAFGDTINDIPMLAKASQKGILFDRKNEAWNNLAKNLGIHIHPWI